MVFISRTLFFFFFLIPNVCVYVCIKSLFAILWTIAWQAPLSMGFSRQEYQSGLPFPPPGIFPTQGLNTRLLHLLQCLGIFLDSQFQFIELYFYPMPLSGSLDDYFFVISFEVRKSFSFVQDCFGYSGSPVFPCEFQDQLVNFCKNKNKKTKKNP